MTIFHTSLVPSLQDSRQGAGGRGSFNGFSIAGAFALNVELRRIKSFLQQTGLGTELSLPTRELGWLYGHLASLAGLYPELSTIDIIKRLRL